MQSFYGDVNNSLLFQFDKIYTSRKAMEDSALQDGIFLNRRVLVRYDANGANFQANSSIDIDAYGQNYNATVWQKVYLNSQEQYIMIARLENDAPTQLEWESF